MNQDPVLQLKLYCGLGKKRKEAFLTSLLESVVWIASWRSLKLYFQMSHLIAFFFQAQQQLAQKSQISQRMFMRTFPSLSWEDRSHLY